MDVNPFEAVGDVKGFRVVARKRFDYANLADLVPGEVFELEGLPNDPKLIAQKLVYPLPRSAKPEPCPRGCGRAFVSYAVPLHVKAVHETPRLSAAEEEAQRRAAIEAAEARDRADYAFARSNPPLWNEILSERERVMRERAATRAAAPATDPNAAARARKNAEIERNRVQAEERKRLVREEVHRRYGL